tara:strand:+ start:252 stop:800 length:549 start_codon:yes stop_codon:yes gene_type:complete
MKFEYNLATLRKETTKKLKDNSWTILYFFLAVIVGVLIFLVVKRFHLSNRIRASLMDPNREFIPADNNKNNDPAKIYLFYVVWCPHSKKAMPHWQRFKQRLQADPKRFNRIEFEEINGDDEDNSSVLKGFNIDAFPLVRLVYNNKTIRFEGKITENNLLSFVEQFVQLPSDSQIDNPLSSAD